MLFNIECDKCNATNSIITNANQGMECSNLKCKDCGKKLSYVLMKQGNRSCVYYNGKKLIPVGYEDGV